MRETLREFPLGLRLEQWVWERERPRKGAGTIDADLSRTYKWGAWSFGRFRSWRGGRLSDDTLSLRLPARCPLQALTRSRSGRWQAHWRWQDEQHSAFVRPHVSFSHRNITRINAREQAERERMSQWEDQQEEWEIECADTTS